MAAAVQYDVPFSLLDHAIKNTSLDDLAQADPTLPYNPNDSSAKALRDRTQIQINNIGAVMYKAMYETHKQRSNIDVNIDYSTFGLDRYERRALDCFQHDYGGYSSNWPSTGHGNRPRGWLSAYIRNSIANNTTSVKFDAGYLVVTVINSRDGRAADFELCMTVRNYVRLIANSVKDHVYKCSTCAVHIERRMDASRNLKLFIPTLTGGRQSERGQVRVNQYLQMRG